MDYHKVYQQIIDKALSENRKRGYGVYYEQHHIIPKCMGGTNDNENLVYLTAREHFIVHKMLPTMYPKFCKELSFALHRMTFSTTDKMKRDYRIGGREFDRIRKEIALAMSGENNPFYGKTQNDDVKNTISLKAKDRLSNPENHPLYGIPCSDERKEKIRIANTGKKATEESRIKMSNSRKGVPKSKEHVINQANSHRGKKRSEETKNKLKVPKPKLVCEFCGQIIGGHSNLQQHINKKHTS